MPQGQLNSAFHPARVSNPLQLGSKQMHHAMHWPRVCVQAGVWLRATEREISAAQWAHQAWERLCFSFIGHTKTACGIGNR